MRKEAWLAIAAGLTIGLIVAYGVARINSSFQHNFPQTVSGSPAPSPQSAENLQIALAKPETDAVVTTNPVIISGLTSPQTWVVILTQDKDYFLTSSANGEFASQITLAGGVNQIEAFGVNQK